MNDFFCFMARPAGRLVRIVAGLTLIGVGRFVLGDTAGWIVAIIGVLPLTAGLFDICIAAPLARLPLVGDDLRIRLGCR